MVAKLLLPMQPTAGLVAAKVDQLAVEVDHKV